jgi:hypothetical protein
VVVVEQWGQVMVVQQTLVVVVVLLTEEGETTRLQCFNLVLAGVREVHQVGAHLLLGDSLFMEEVVVGHVLTTVAQVLQVSAISVVAVGQARLQ